jgi:hypothetical protein
MNTIYCRCCGSEVINCVCRIPDDEEDMQQDPPPKPDGPEHEDGDNND